ncbi:MAG: response regulator [Cyanobacteria bacterium SZAS-4]|nr:response regulator [Cyanobacteria bacterium SZAS-4]
MQPQKVLFVDDDPNIRRIAQIVLSNIGKYDVLLACCGSDALSLAQQTKPDLILMDVMMPDMDGPTTLVKLREMNGFNEVPVIFVTAKVQKHELHIYTQNGALGVITKPFDPMNLCADIDALLHSSVSGGQPNMKVQC